MHRIYSTNAFVCLKFSFWVKVLPKNLPSQYLIWFNIWMRNAYGNNMKMGLCFDSIYTLFVLVSGPSPFFFVFSNKPIDNFIHNYFQEWSLSKKLFTTNKFRLLLIETKWFSRSEPSEFHFRTLDTQCFRFDHLRDTIAWRCFTLFDPRKFPISHSLRSLWRAFSIEEIAFPNA